MVGKERGGGKEGFRARTNALVAVSAVSFGRSPLQCFIGLRVTKVSNFDIPCDESIRYWATPPP